MAKDLLLDDLNQAQKEAVTHGEGPLLIVAGAGTGKTTVITRRIAWLIREGKAKGDEILGLTFTDKAAGEMEERVDRLLPMGYVDLWLSTFHAFGERMLRAHAIDIGLPNDFTLLNQTGQWMLMRRNFIRFDLDYYRPLGNPTKFIHALLKHFSRAKDEGVSADEYLEYVENLKLNAGAGESTGGAVIARKLKTQNSKLKIMESFGDNSEIVEGEVGRFEEIAKAYKGYEQLLLDEGNLDFGDLIISTLRLLRSRPKILAQYRHQFKYLLVDEFQDTNWAQYELVKLIAGPRQNVTVVADDDQSIYRFRGAAMSNILQFEKDFPAAKFVVLTENYRSMQGILDLSYQLIQKNNPNRLEARSNSTHPPLNIRGGEGGVMKRLKAIKLGAAIISLLQAKSAEDEIRLVIEKIAEVKEKDKELSWNDFAILVRANNQADAFVSALSQAGIPCQYVASKGLYAKPIVLDVVNWLKLLDNYHESPSLWRILNAPHFAVPWGDVIELTGYAQRKALSLYEALKHARMISGVSEEGRKIIERIIVLIERETQASRTQSVGKVILQFLDESGYMKYLAGLPDGEAQTQFLYLNQFFKAVSEFEQSILDTSVRAFLEAYALEVESGDAGALEMDLDEGPETVKVMTVHAAKGLEFHTVFVVQLVDKRFPSVARGDPIEFPQALVKEFVPEGDIHLEEERRLLYVAMTRAKQNLFFTLAEDYGGARKKKPSVFLQELGMMNEEEEGKKVKEGRKVEANTRQDYALTRQASQGVINASQGIYQLPAKFSFTQLKVFKTCPYQYRLAHILKVPTKGRFTFSFGKTMHATLQNFFSCMQEGGGQSDLFGKKDGRKDATVPPLKALLEWYEKNWIDDWYESPRHKEEYREKGRKILKEFYARVAESPPSPKYLEQGFNLKLVEASPRDGDASACQTVTIRGVIDRIDEVEGGVEIVDYKTGRVKDLDTADKDQLLIYQVAAAEVLGLTPIKLTYYYLDEQKPVSFIGTEDQVEDIKAKILDTVEAIKQSDFKATPSPQVCRFCDFKEICEFRQL